ncbi:hypothetical protein Tco_1126593 [Tanacetum coccineum]
MDDEPMWAADRVVALTPGSAITIPKTTNEFAIKGNQLTLVKGNQFDGNAQKLPWSQSIQRFADKQSGQPSGSLPSNTQSNLKVNPNDQPNDSEAPVNFGSDDEDDEPTPQPKPIEPKPVKETPIPKPYKPKVQYPQRLRKEKMEARYVKFLKMIRAI